MKTILFYPELLHESSIMFKLIKHLGWNITNNINDYYDYIFNWEDTTYRNFYPELKELSKDQKILNLGATDISKRHVEEVFEEVFGYSMKVNPLTFEGFCVEKSDINASHTGTIINCPIKESEIKKEHIYQRLIETKFDDENACDYRTPIIFGTIPFVYKRLHSLEKRFASGNTKVDIFETDNVYSKQEQNLILEFAKKFGVDYCEMDILRDNHDKKVYIVDVNTTPWGPPKNIGKEDKKLAIDRLSKAVKENIFN